MSLSEMSLSHHSWRSSHDTAADDRRFGAETDRTRRISRRINDHAPVATHRQLSTRSRSTPRLFDLPGTAITSISTVWMKFGVPRNAIGGTSGRTALVGAPSPARAGRPRRSTQVSRVSTRLASSPHLMGWPGWRNYRILWLLCEPSPTCRHACFRRTIPVGCNATGCGPALPLLPHTSPRSARLGHELHPCGLCPDSTDHEGCPFPGPELIARRPSDGHPARPERDHSQSRGTRQ
jgi:hypothetical protein